MGSLVNRKQLHKSPIPIPMKEGNLLIVDDNRNIVEALLLFLPLEFERVDAINGPQQLIQQLSSGKYDVLLLDMNFSAGKNSGAEGIYWLREIRKKFPGVEVVMMTAYGDIHLAVQSLKDGAIDFVLKPWDNEKLVATLKAALRYRQTRREMEGMKEKEAGMKKEMMPGRPRIIGTSPAMQNVMNLVNKVAATEANILITGENGTGKELIAREIHYLSDRRDELFVMVDLSSLTETLFESELFGHKKGAFTDAHEERMGKLVLANKGTLFLDEIGNLPVHLQSKLLTVLQTRVVTPVGSNKEIPFDIRLICATNKNLPEMVSGNLFRQDLLYRINTIQLHLPPLRDRIEDIGDLAGHFLAQFARKYNKEGIHLCKEALEKLKKNAWYGNIREFMNAIEKAVILSEGKEILASAFESGPVFESTHSHDETLEQAEKRVIRLALERNQYNLSSAATQLGITRPTLYNKIKKYGL